MDNCTPYDVIFDRNDILGILDTESDDLIPLEDSTISAILSDIDKHLPKVPKKKLTKAEIAEKANLNVPSEYKQRYVDILYKHQNAISAKNMTSGLPLTSNIRSISKTMPQCTGNNSKFPRRIKISLNNH